MGSGPSISTHSYQSQKDAIRKMFEHLDDNDIRVYYDYQKQLYFIIEHSATRRYIQTRKTLDVLGYDYYECYIEVDRKI
jgi:hypothetical protein